MSAKAMSEPAGHSYTPSEDLAMMHFVAVIGGRRLSYESIPIQARFRVTMAHVWAGKSDALGSVIKLNSDEPDLRVCAPLEVEWATANSEEIVAAAVRAWDSITRHCEG